MILIFVKQNKAHFHIRQNFQNQSHPLACIVLPNIPGNIAMSFLSPIFTQSKNFQNPDIKMKGTSPTSADNTPSNPHLFSVILYIFILLLFRKTSFSFISTFCRVSGKCSFNSFPASFFAFSCISSYTSHLSRLSSLFSILSNFS